MTVIPAKSVQAVRSDRVRSVFLNVLTEREDVNVRLQRLMTFQPLRRLCFGRSLSACTPDCFITPSFWQHNLVIIRFS